MGLGVSQRTGRHRATITRFEIAHRSVIVFAMTASERVIGVAHEPDGTASGWDFWWRNATGDVVAVFHGFGGGGSGPVLASWVRDGLTEPESAALEARARWPIERAQEIALARVTPRGVAGGSMACVAIGSDRVVIAHVGDARVYALTNARLEQLTRDHMLSQSNDPEHQKLRALHPDVDALLRAIGMEEGFAIDVREHTRGAHDVLALCTRGVYGSFDDDELGRCLALGRDAPAHVHRRLHDEDRRRPGAFAMILPSRENAVVARGV